MQNEHSAAPAQPEASMLAAEAVPASSSMVGHRSGRSAWSEELVKVGLSVEHCRVAKAAKASPHAGSTLADGAKPSGTRPGYLGDP